MGAPLNIPRRSLSVDEFEKIVASGVFLEDDRIELIEGELIAMAPIGWTHVSVVNRLTKLLVIGAGDDAVVSVQNPVALPPRNEPQPDVTLLRPEYEAQRVVPRPENLLLVIEVADSTLRYDRDTKVPIYARNGVPEVWVIDVNTQTVHVYRDGGLHGYQQQLQKTQQDLLSPSLLPRVSFRVSELFL
jgi:Uma2 family endonuclease